jgi:hypothetical protein
MDICIDNEDIEWEWDGDPTDDGYQEYPEDLERSSNARVVRFKGKRKQSNRSKHRLWACGSSRDLDLDELRKKANIWSGSAVTLICFHEPIRRDNISRYAKLRNVCCLETVTRHNSYSWHADAADLLGWLAKAAPERIEVSAYIRAIAAPLAAGEEFQPQLFHDLEGKSPLVLASWLELARNVRIAVPKHNDERAVGRLSVRNMDPFRKRQYWAARKRIQREKQSADMLDIEEQGVNTAHLDRLADSGYQSDDFDELNEKAVHYLRRVYGYKFKDHA